MVGVVRLGLTHKEYNYHVTFEKSGRGGKKLNYTFRVAFLHECILNSVFQNKVLICNKKDIKYCTSEDNEVCLTIELQELSASASME